MSEDLSSPLDELRTAVIERIAPKWAGLVHNQDDGVDSATHAFDNVMEAIRNVEGVVGMPLHESSSDYDLAGLDEDGDVIPYVNVLKP